MAPLESIHIKRFTLTLPGAKLVHHHAYPVPHVLQQTLKKEIDHMVELVILKPCRASEWASLAFIIPKKDGHIRQITDLCSLSYHSKTISFTNHYRHA